MEVRAGFAPAIIVLQTIAFLDLAIQPLAGNKRNARLPFDLESNVLLLN